MENRLMALEARISALEDEKAIREVLARYGYYADACLDEEYFNLFTEDCVMDVSSGRADNPFEVIRWEGLAKMRDFLAVRTAEHDNGFYGRSMHMQGNNLTVRITGTTATANGYSFIFHQDGPTLRLLSASMNEWQLLKRDDRWLIHQRKRRMAGAPDAAELLRASEG